MQHVDAEIDATCCIEESHIITLKHYTLSYVFDFRFMGVWLKLCVAVPHPIQPRRVTIHYIPVLQKDVGSAGV